MALTDKLTNNRTLTSVQTSAGKGTRFRPLNLDSAASMIPKGLTRIMGLPLAELQIYQFKETGITENYIITQFLENRDPLGNRFGEGKNRTNLGLNIDYSDPENDDTNNGSGDAILTNIEEKELTGDSIIFANDNIYEVDFEKAIKWHRKNNAVISVMTTLIRPRDTIKNYGLVSVETDYRISALNEKPDNETELMKILGITNPDLLKDMRVPINTAGYVVNNDALREISKEGWVVEGRKKSSGDFDMAGKFIKELIGKDYPIFNSPINAWGDFGSITFFLDTFPDALSGKFPSIYQILEQQGYYHNSKKNVWIHPQSLNKKDKKGKTLKERMNKGIVNIGPNVFIGRNSKFEDGVEISYSNLEKYANIKEGVQLNRVYLSPYCRIHPYAELRECALGLGAQVNSSKEAPTRIDGRTVTGAKIIIPAGSVLNGVEIYPGYSFSGPIKAHNVQLKPSLEHIIEVVKSYGVID